MSTYYLQVRLKLFYSLSTVKIGTNTKIADRNIRLELLQLSVAQTRQSCGSMFPLALRHIVLIFTDAATQPLFTC